MIVFMIKSIFYVDETDLHELKSSHYYKVLDQLGKMMCKDQVAAEYIKVGGSQ